MESPTWINSTLGEQLTFQRGFDITKKEQIDGPYPVVSSSGPNTTHNEYKVKGPGLVIGRKGTLGTVFYIQSDFWPHDTSLWVNDFHGNDRKFAYYFVKTMGFSQYDCGASNPTLNRNHIHTIPIVFPSVPVQRKIASILTAYDDLIENNTRRIAILEAMAQAIYREWFVEFRFPGHETVKFVDSPLGKIPEGWRITSLKAITTKIGSGATPRGGKESYQTNGISLIRSMNIYDNQFELKDLAFIDSDQAAQLDNVTIQKRDILLNITGASVARCCMVPSYLIPARVNQHVAIIRVDSIAADPFYVLNTINSERHKRQILTLAQGGATREALTKDIISNYEIVLPPKNILRQYADIISNVFDQRELLQKKNNCLRKTRDLLLPKLISGRLDVENLDIEIADFSTVKT